MSGKEKPPPEVRIGTVYLQETNKGKPIHDKKEAPDGVRKALQNIIDQFIKAYQEYELMLQKEGAIPEPRKTADEILDWIGQITEQNKGKPEGEQDEKFWQLRALFAGQPDIATDIALGGDLEKAKETLKAHTSYYRENRKKNAPQIPRSPNPFDGGETASVANNPPAHVLFEACAKGGPNARKQVNGWKENTQGKPVFQKPQRAKGDWTVYFDPQADSAIAPWGRVEGLSALHVKIGLFFLARICDPRSQARHPAKDPVGVSYEDLRSVLGYTKRGEALGDFKERMNQIVKDWADLKATVRGIMINGKPDGIAECSLFTISKVWDAQYELFNERVQIGWLIDPGPWAKHYFNQDAKPWLATLHQTLLKFDHRGVRLAEVLALHIATLLFVVAGGDQFKEQAITRTVAELLEIAGRLPEKEHRGPNWANRTAEALQVALETLLGARLLAAMVFGPTYPDPGDRGKGWVERWLSATITLAGPDAAAFLGRDIPEPLAEPPARLERLEKKLRTQKPEPAKQELLDETTASRLRAAIAQKFPNQTKAARHFGCSQSALSRAVNRETAPNPELATKLKAFLDSPELD